MTEKRFSGKALASLVTLAGFVIMTVSGIIELIRPAGRISYWVHWSLFGLQKTAWDNIHIIGSIMFIVGGGFHIYYNWKPIIKYFSAKTARALRHKRELIITAALAVWVVVSGIWSLPPLHYVVDLSGAIQSTWVISADYEPPFGHAELLSLKVFCKRMGIPSGKALAELKKNQIKITSVDQSLEQIALANGLMPMDIYAIIKKLEPQPPALEKGQKLTAAQVEGLFAGSGLGRKPLRDVFQQLKVDPAQAFKRLEAIGIKAKETESARDIAQRTGKNPLDLIKVMLAVK